MSKKLKYKKRLPKKEEKMQAGNPGKTYISLPTSDLFYKKVTYALLALLSLFMVITAFETFIPADEPIDIAYGDQCINYFKSGMTDLGFETFKVYDRGFPNQKYYGAGFEMTANLIANLFPASLQFHVRHIQVVCCCMLIIYLSMLITKKLSNWQGAMVTVLLFMASSIFLGNGLFNSKDIPFAMGFVVSYYFLIQYFDENSVRKKLCLLGVVLGIAISISVRVGGLLIIAYCFAYIMGHFLFLHKAKLFKKDNLISLLRSGALFSGVGVVGLIIGLLFYPNFFEMPFDHLTNALGVVSNFPARIMMIFEGNQIFSTKLPPNYLIKSILITFPLFMFLLSGLYLLFFKSIIRKIGYNNYLFILLTALFPIVWIIMTKAPIYNGWRHIIFMYPSFIMLSSLATVKILQSKKQYVLIIGLVVLGVLWARPVYWNIRNALFQYSYYNEFVGGVDGAMCEYDVDYQQLGTSRLLAWTLDNVEPKKGDKKENDVHFNIIGSNNGSSLAYHPSLANSAWSMSKIAYKQYSASLWDYAILSTLFVPSNLIKSHYPPTGNIHNIKINNTVIATLLHREDYNDYNAFLRLQGGDYNGSLAYLKKAIKASPDNVFLKFWLGVTYHQLGKYKLAGKLLEDYERFYPNEYILLIFLGNNYVVLGETAKAEIKLVAALNARPKQENAYTSLIALYKATGESQKLSKVKELLKKL